MHKPLALIPGARIGVVAPAGSVDESALLAGVAAIRQAGFEVEIGRGVSHRNGYLAGDARDRARELSDFFRRDDIAAIICARGGFGSIQILEHLDHEIKNYPKPFVGYSDITILLHWLSASCEMVTFHGPMVATDLARGLSERGKAHFWGLLTGATRHWQVQLGEVIQRGKVAAAMTGGCLSMLVTTLGTAYEIDTRGKLLFLEDVGEAPYRIERMLTHLKMAGKFDHVAGILFGDFTNCNADGPRDLRMVITEMFGQVRYPVVMGFPGGHGDENLALPFGVQMCLDGVNGSLELLEAPVM